jgi:hypothetical protein
MKMARPFAFRMNSASTETKSGYGDRARPSFLSPVEAVKQWSPGFWERMRELAAHADMEASERLRSPESRQDEA